MRYKDPGADPYEKNYKERVIKNFTWVTAVGFWESGGLQADISMFSVSMVLLYHREPIGTT